MPFMRGAMPLRRTFFYLEQGKVVLRDNVAILLINYHTRPLPEQQGLSHFVFWHFAQLQYKNPHLQAIKQPNYCITPFVMAFLKDGREVLFDFENKTKDEITNTIQGTLGKTPLVKKREYLEHMQDHNPAQFGSSCKRHCLCEIQGQVSCPSIMPVPLYLESNWRWNHNAT